MKKIYSYCLATLSTVAMLLAVGCNDPKPEVPDVPEPSAKSPTISVIADEAQATISSAVVLVTVTNADRFEYTYYPKDERPTTIEWKKVTVAADGEMAVEINDLGTNISNRSLYTFEAKAYLQDSVSKAATCNFQTMKAAPVMLSDVKASGIMISAVATILPEHCDGYCWTIMNKADYTADRKAQFRADIEEGFETVVKEDAVLKSAPMSVSPDQVCVLVVQPIELGEDGKFKEYIGAAIEVEVTTPACELGQSEAAVTFTVDKESLSFSGVKFKATRADTTNIGGIFYGTVTKAVLGNKSIDSYITDGKWFTQGGNGSENYKKHLSFANGISDVEYNFMLVENTAYVVFVVATDQYGLVGKVASEEITTPALAFDDPATVEAVVIPKHDELHFSLTYKEGCEKVYWMSGPKGAISADDAQEKLVANALDPWNGDYWMSTVPEECKVFGLNELMEYDVYMLPVSAAGKFGAIVKVTEKTSKFTVEFNSLATLTFELGTPVLNARKTAWVYPFTVTPGADMVTYDYITMTVEEYDAGLVLSLIDMYKSGGLYSDPGPVNPDDPDPLHYSVQIVGDPNNVVAADKYVVFVPIDDSGLKGAPVFKKVEVPVVPPKPENPDEPGPRALRRR